MAQTLTNVKAETRVVATMATGATNTSGSLTIGDSSTVSTTLTGADIAYAFRLNATGGTDVVTLTGSSGALAKTTGTPDIERWGTQTSDLAAEDLHGVTLATAVNYMAIKYDCPSSNTGNVAVASAAADGVDVEMVPDSRCVLEMTSGTLVGNITFTFTNAGDEITVTVIAKSS